MIVSLPVFSTIVVASLLLVVAAPLILLYLLLRDWRRGQLW